MLSDPTKKPLVPDDDMRSKWVAEHMADARQRRTPGGGGTLTPASLDPVNARLATVHYFDAWHQVTFDNEPASMPIAPDLLLQFIVDHTDGLTDDVAKAIEARRTRRADGRTYPATVEDHIQHISEAHIIGGLGDPADDVQIRKALRVARDQGNRKT